MAQSGRLLEHNERANEITSVIRSGNYDEAKRLISIAGINITDGYGRTPLINCVLNGDSDLVSWLIDQGADVNLQDKAGYSALHFAGQERAVEIASILLSKGANPNLIDIHGNSPLWTAIFNAKHPSQEQGVVVLLLKCGANPDWVNAHGKSPRFMYQTFHNKDLSI
jgi:hypothetical protein